MAAARASMTALQDPRKDGAKLSDRDLLRALGVVSATGQMLRSGTVLLGSRGGASPQIVYQYRATPGGEPRFVERLSGPLLLGLQRVLALVSARQNLTQVNLPDGQQLQLADFPDAAVREALANAVMHRDYTFSTPISVEHSPEVLVVTSPGPLVAGVTPENILTHPSTPRNPSLAEALRKLGFAEQVGRGVDRMYREMIRTGREYPGIASEPDRVRVSLVGGAPNTVIARFIAQLPPDEREDTDTLLVIFALRKRRTITASDIAQLLQKSTEETEAVLRRLTSNALAIVEPTRSTARFSHPTYRLRSEALRELGSAVGYQRRAVDDIDRKVIAHVREYGRITNRTVQNLVEVGLQRAKAILADLVKREILKKTSAHQRGPGVEYGAGRRFPATSAGGRSTSRSRVSGSRASRPVRPRRERT